jgi:hypothetical protein
MLASCSEHDLKIDAELAQFQSGNQKISSLRQDMWSFATIAPVR